MSVLVVILLVPEAVLEEQIIRVVVLEAEGALLLLGLKRVLHVEIVVVKLIVPILLVRPQDENKSKNKQSLTR